MYIEIDTVFVMQTHHIVSKYKFARVPVGNTKQIYNFNMRFKAMVCYSNS